MKHSKRTQKLLQICLLLVQLSTVGVSIRVGLHLLVITGESHVSATPVES